MGNRGILGGTIAYGWDGVYEILFVFFSFVQGDSFKVPLML